MRVMGRPWLLRTGGLLALGTASLAAQTPAAQLQDLVREALAASPELAGSRSLTEAARERVPQARALPDPTVTLGLQNDGFQRIQVGRMETSYYQVMATQGLPWPGKRGLRGEIASLGAQASETAIDRIRLGVEADVRRAYVGLLLVRGQQALLADQAVLLERSEAATRARYEAGQGAQSDLLRAQVARIRLDPTRLALQAQERSFLAALNRLLGRESDADLPTPGTLDALPLAPQAAAAILERAERKSPELRAARLGIRQAERSLDLARLDRRPDLAVTAGLMPRGGLDPMWQVGVSVSVPLWSGHKQQRAVAEQDLRRRAQGSELEGLRRRLAQRIRERAAQLEAALASIRIYREGLLVQSDAAFQAALAQFEAGRAPFLGVLEALNGLIADRSGLLQTEAQAQALQIAQDELNPGETPAITAQGLAAASLGMGGSPAPAARAVPPAGAPPGDAGRAMTSM
jgi:outer membrane protein, heavy metal efflux system